MTPPTLQVVLILATGTSLVAAAGVKQCHVCKSSQAGATFANLVCDRIPAMAPDCDNFNKSSLSFLQFCSANQNCLFISKGKEQLRMCTTKQTVETLRTTKGILMAICDRELCNSATTAVTGTALPALLLVLVPLLLAAATPVRQ
ncbi:hypothetical protein FJT64_001370 [Amphibalanus amphitrite]|uniref:Protein quiver n=1 Tax=Amphibalanus amphitrite TaxID=1232801 RepID=A0A6A4VHB7_AMPAM|nr:hypothetical protein FJT64_001370 [Amphibalanus amphitrite]